MEEAELLADTVAIISKGKITAMGSPGELIESNANYLALTLQSVDVKIFDIVRMMGFEPVHDNHKNIKVRVEHADDVRVAAVAGQGPAPDPAPDVTDVDTSGTGLQPCSWRRAQV
jgi:ABC-type multidrug transport system ATPase subunit